MMAAIMQKKLFYQKAELKSVEGLSINIKESIPSSVILLIKNLNETAWLF